MEIYTSWKKIVFDWKKEYTMVVRKGHQELPAIAYSNELKDKINITNFYLVWDNKWKLLQLWKCFKFIFFK